MIYSSLIPTLALIYSVYWFFFPTTQTQIKLTKLKSNQPKLKLPANHHHQHNQIFHSHHHRFENPPTPPISKINLKPHHQSTNPLPLIGKPMISKLTTISKSGTNLIRGTREGWERKERSLRESVYVNERKKERESREREERDEREKREVWESVSMWKRKRKRSKEEERES